MTAASGILHREYHEEEYARRGGVMHMIQLWVNLPSAHKMSAPRYQALLGEHMGRVKLEDGAGEVRVIAGELAGKKGPAKTVTKVSLFDVRLEPTGRVVLPAPAAENAAVLVMKGRVRVAGAASAGPDDFVVFENEGDEVSLEAEREPVHAMFLAGEPIDEPVAQYGPFVMNTRQEIEQAITDFNAGKFGQLED
jgi:redox-sensitive bicupin YhaK (pirin superfamily)